MGGEDFPIIKPYDPGEDVHKTIALVCVCVRVGGGGGAKYA